MKKKLLLFMALLLSYIGVVKAQQSLPYEYGFEDNNLTTDGWVLQGATSTSTGILVNTAAAHSGANGFRFNYSEQSAYLVSPILTGGDLGIDVSFWYKEYSNQYGDEQFQVGYTTDETVTDASEFTYGDVVTASTDWKQYEGSFPAGTKRIAIKYIYNDVLYLFLDDFSFSAASSCPKPTGLTVSNISDVSAVISWTSDADDWDLMVNGTLIENVTNPYTLTGLTPGENYAVQVRTHCGGTEYSDYTSAISFNTSFCLEEDQCVITYELADSYGDGWTGNAINVVDAETGTVLATLTIADGSSAVGAVAVCPGREIQFQWVSGGTNSYPNECSYIIKNANGDEILNGSNTLSAPVSYIVDCTVSLYKKPTNLTATEVGAHSAVLSWTENGEATEWVISYFDNDEEEEHFATATSNPFTLTGLNVNTEYWVKVRPAGENDVWSDGIFVNTFFPTPGAVTASNVTTNAADISWTGSASSYDVRYAVNPGGAPALLQYDNDTYVDGIGNSSAMNWTWGVMYPGSLVTSSKLTSVSIYEGNASTGDITINIYTGGDSAPGTLVYTEVVTPEGNGAFHDITLATPANIVAGQNVWITLTETGTYVMSACETTEANNQWVEDGGSWYNISALASSLAGYGWMIRASISDFNEATATWTTQQTTDNTFQLTGLTEDTNYAVQVRANYEDGASDWSPSTFFTTLSSNPIPTNVEVANVLHNSATVSWEGASDSYKVKYRIPAGQEVVFFDDFENGLDQWTTVRNGGGTTNTDWRTTDATGFDGGTNHSGNNVVMSRSWATNAYSVDNWLISPQVTLDGTLKFWVRDDGMYHEHYDIYVSTTTNDIDAFELLNSPGNATDAWKEVSVDLSSYAGQQGYIAIRHTDEDQDFLWIDDFGIYGGEIPAGAWQEVATDETTAELTGLETDTEYEVVVVGIKGGEENEGSAPVTFTTLSDNDKLFVTAGNWDVAENWLPAGVPTATSNLIIQKDVTIPAGVIALANIVVLDGGSITVKDGGQLKQNTGDLVVTIEKNIKGYGESTEAADYNLIASSLGVNVTVNSTGALTGTRDMYSFSQNQTQEWRRVQNGNVAAANGYLYASQDDRTLKFTGATLASVDNGVTLSITYDESATYSFNGYQLIGNPYPCDAYVAYIDGSYNIQNAMFYKTNAAGDGFNAYYQYAKLAPGEAAFIQVYGSGYVYLNSDPIFEDEEPEAWFETFVPVLPQHGLTGNQDADLNLLLADDGTDNTEKLEKYANEQGNVTLQGRTLYKDGSWNTLTLPFDVTLADSPLAGATAKTLSEATMTGSSVVLTFGEAVEELTAGTPYIIKWEDGENIVNPVFNNVYITSTAGTAIEKADNNVKFNGYYDAFTIDASNDDIWYLTADNTLKRTGQERTLNAFRAYFQLSEDAAARSLVLNFEDISTGIGFIPAELVGKGDWYTVDGVKLNGVPTRKGLYINNGKKVVIK